MLKPLLIAALLIAPAAHAQLYTHAEVYSVTGVASNDTLNVRAAPNVGAVDIGDLYPNQPVEVIMLSQDRKWGQIIWDESNGWISMRFLRPTPLPTMQDSEMPTQLSCSGTEPFWSAIIWPNRSLEFTDYASSNPEPSFQRINQSTTAMGYAPVSFAFSAGEFTGLLERAQCSDGMSDITFGWQIRLIAQQNGGITLRNGCCSANLN